MDAIKRTNIQSHALLLKGDAMPKVKSKSTVTLRGNTRSVLGEIHNVNIKLDLKRDNGPTNKLTLGRKLSNPFINVKSKVDSNLHPVNKTVIRKLQSCTTLDTRKTFQAKPDKIKADTSKLINLSKLQNENVGNDSLTPEMMKELDKIDDVDRKNPFMVVEYRKEIYRYLLHLETVDPIEPTFLEGKNVTKKMREILIGWIFGVHEKFKLLLETLQMTISLLDRYIMKSKPSDITKANFQLVGIAVMILACKYEEIYIPDIQDFEIMCQHAFTAHEIRTMQCTILRALEFNLSPPLPINFLRRYSKASHAETIHHAMGKYFIELLLFDSFTCYYKPSLIAAASICMALALLNKDQVMPSVVWSPALQYYSTYKYKDIQIVVNKLAKILERISHLKDHHVMSKYSELKYMKVAKHQSLRSIIIPKLASKLVLP